MEKKEIEKAIENGDRVWVLDKDENEIEELYFYKNNIYEFDKNDLFINKFWIYEFRNLFKTKAKAEHYLHHANVSRIEYLPFLTWEEFLEKRCFYFTNYSDYYGMDTVNKEFSLKLNVSRDKILLFSYDAIPLEEWEATESNFYKAYDECVALFRGE